jgi:flagellar assembly protein FliH
MTETSKFLFRDLSPFLNNPSGKMGSVSAIKEQLNIPPASPAPKKPAAQPPAVPKQKNPEELATEKWAQREKEFSSQLEQAKKLAHDEGYAKGLAQGKEDGHAQGLEEGRGELKALEEQSLSALKHIGEELQRYEALITTNTATLTEESISLSLAIAKKVTSDTLQQNAEAIVTTALNRALESLTAMPEIIIYVNPSLINTLQDRLQKLTAEKNLKGSVRLEADEKLETADCRVTWDNGAFERSSKAIWDRVEALYQQAKTDPVIAGKPPEAPKKAPEATPDNTGETN